MYKMMSFFLNAICKHIEHAGKVPTRAHDARTDVFIGRYGPDKVVFCYKGEFFFVLPKKYREIFGRTIAIDGPDFGNMSFGTEFECCFSGVKKLHPVNQKTTLRELVSIHDEAPNIFSKRRDNQTVYYDKAYIQERYAGWLEEISDFYGGQTEIWTDSKGAFTLKRLNGDVLAVALEVRI